MQHKLQPGQLFGGIRKHASVGGVTLTETSYDPKFRIPRHWHAHNYISVVLKGEFIESFGKRTKVCRPGCIIFHPAGEIHSEAFGKVGGRLFNIEVDSNWFGRSKKNFRGLEKSGAFVAGTISGVALKIYREFLLMDELSPLAIEGLMLEMLVEVSRGSGDKLRKGPPLWLEQAKRLLQERFSEKLSLDEIAKSVHVHPVHLASVFRRYFRLTVGEYIRQLRTDFACRELSTSDRPLNEIAAAAGFSDQSHLSRTLKRITNMTPSQYRNKARLP